MKTQWTRQYSMIVALWVISLCGSLWAQGSFLDDFSDGSIKDGSPVTWGWDDDGTGERLVDAEGLHLNAMAPYAILRNDQDNDAIYSGNMSIQMQLRMHNHENWGNTGIYFRATRTDYYKAGIILNQLYLYKAKQGIKTYIAQPDIPGFSPTQQDIIIQIDVTDFRNATGNRTSRLEVYCWFPGQHKPTQPQISAVDSTLSQGNILMYVDRCSATFRWIEVMTESTEPVVDFNGDGTVDIKDLVRMIESWGQNDPALDIAPLSMADGTVDVNDLEVLMSYWQQEVNDPTLRTHLTLDETEGDIAYDNAGDHDAVLQGNPEWQTNLGQINGALSLDGINDSVLILDFLNPANGAFSAFAWIKGGAPGQVILSQANAANWLMADTELGALGTGLTDTNGDAQNETQEGLSLISTCVITDNNWHRVGIVWNGKDRILYVDDQEVARDTPPTPQSAPTCLSLGMGCTLESSSRWSGLIDDVRIYDRAVSP